VTGESKAVFLSYAAEDSEAASRIADALKAAGIEVWFDQSELRGGEIWDLNINEQIHRCQLFMPVISAHTEARDEGYFRREWSAAVDRMRDMAEHRAFLVPVAIDGTAERQAAVPERFHHVQWMKLADGEPTPTFVNRVAELLGRPNPSMAADGAAHVAVAIPKRPKPARRVTWVALGALVLAVGLGGGWVAWRQLWRPAQSTPPSVATSENSIAVLPFADMSERKDQEYFADGMAEEILDLLAKLPAVKVIGRTSSFAFKGRNLDLRQIGLSLGAAFLVEGSVRLAGNQLRVTAQLIRAGDGSHVWSETYNESPGDALRIQQRIATSIVRALQVSVGIDDVRPPVMPRVPEAYDLYLRGRHAFDRFDAPGFVDALT
jgi:TolB-like protein